MNGPTNDPTNDPANEGANGPANEGANGPTNGPTNDRVNERANLSVEPDAGDPSDLTPGEPVVGVGPHQHPWPDDPRLDPELLEHGDRRNVVDLYRYWTMEAIVADLDTRRQPLRIAIQNWEHDFNIGSMVRTANAFNVAGVHIVGRRRWNRRGAMVTDRYLHVEHHPSVADFTDRMAELGHTVIGIDNLPGSVPLETATLPERACLVFGSEGPGLTEEMLAACEQLVAISQYGSTRSINAGAAAAIAMYAWSVGHLGRGGQAPFG